MLDKQLSTIKRLIRAGYPTSQSSQEKVSAYLNLISEVNACSKVLSFSDLYAIRKELGSEGLAKFTVLRRKLLSGFPASGKEQQNIVMQFLDFSQKLVVFDFISAIKAVDPKKPNHVEACIELLCRMSKSDREKLKNSIRHEVELKNQLVKIFVKAEIWELTGASPEMQLKLQERLHFLYGRQENFEECLHRFYQKNKIYLVHAVIGDFFSKLKVNDELLSFAEVFSILKMLEANSNHAEEFLPAVIFILKKFKTKEGGIYFTRYDFKKLNQIVEAGLGHFDSGYYDYLLTTLHQAMQQLSDDHQVEEMPIPEEDVQCSMKFSSQVILNTQAHLFMAQLRNARSVISHELPELRCPKERQALLSLDKTFETVHTRIHTVYQDKTLLQGYLPRQMYYVEHAITQTKRTISIPSSFFAGILSSIIAIFTGLFRGNKNLSSSVNSVEKALNTPIFK